MSDNLSYDKFLLEKYGMYQGDWQQIILFQHIQTAEWDASVHQDTDNIWSVNTHFTNIFENASAINPAITFSNCKIETYNNSGFTMSILFPHLICYQELPIALHYIHTEGLYDNLDRSYEVGMFPIAKESATWSEHFMPEFADHSEWKGSRVHIMENLHDLQCSMQIERCDGIISTSEKKRDTAKLQMDEKISKAYYEDAVDSINYYSDKKAVIQNQGSNFKLTADHIIRNRFKQSDFVKNTSTWQNVMQTYHKNLSGILKACTLHDAMFAAYKKQGYKQTCNYIPSKP